MKETQRRTRPRPKTNPPQQLILREKLRLQLYAVVHAMLQNGGGMRYLLILPLVWILLSAIPVAPFPIGTGMDASWNYALNIAHAKGIPFGTHLVITMGPLGYLATPDPDYTGKNAALAFILLTYGLLAYGVIRCARLAGIGAALTTAVVLVTQILLCQHFPDAWQAAYMALFLAAAAGSGRTLVDLALSGLVTGFTLLFKVNEGITACAIFACLLAYSLYRYPAKKRAHIFIALLPLLVLLTGMQMIQGNALAAFPYMRKALQTMSGFSLAASSAGPLWQSGLAFLYIALVFAAPLLLGARSTLLGPGIVPGMIVGFMAFKHGMVRQDSHADMVMVKIAIAALFLMFACDRASDRRIIGSLAIFGASFTMFIVAQNQEFLFNRAFARIQPAGMADSIRALASFDIAWEGIRADIHAHLLPLRLDPRFGQIINGATVDAFPENIDVIRANGWNYLPRPGIQSSSAFTPSLDDLNAAYINGGNASRFAVFVWYAIDNRHPFMQDPRTLLALVDNYDAVYKDDKALLLARRSSRRFKEPEWIGSTVASLGKLVAVPAVPPTEIVMARVDIAPTLWGRLFAFLFRGPVVYVQVNYKSGQSRTYQVVSSNLAGGAIISSLPTNLSEFSMFLDAQPSIDPVVTVTWGILLGTGGGYRSTIPISWYRIRRAEVPLASKGSE